MLKAASINCPPKVLLKKRVFLLYAIFIVVAFLLSLGQAPVAQGQDSPKAASALISKAQAADSVRVIVKLNTSFQPEGHLSGPQAAVGQRTRISKMQDQLHEAVSKHKVKGIKKFKYIPYTAMEVDSAALDALIANPLVVSIQEDIPVPPTLTDSVPLIKADLAWTAGYTGAGWTVAILDTGVDKTHSFIGAAKVVSEACYSSTSDYPSTTVCPGGVTSSTASGSGVNCGGANGTDIAGCQHGTHVAGIAAGKAMVVDGKTIAGVAKEANIIAIQVFSRFTTACAGYGLSSPCALSYTSDQILALERVYALRTSYNVAAVNMSLGGGKYTSNCDASESAIKTAIENLRLAGIATVIASGNSDYTDGIGAPACVSTAVSVGATTKSDVEATYSNYHPTMLSLFAPGSSINSSIPNEKWVSWDGTSMATPHVTGAWAILKQKSNTATVDSILINLQTTGATVTKKAGDMAGGDIKRIDVLAALNAVGSAPNRPGNLSASALSMTRIDLSWTDNSSDETGFKIERKTGLSGTYSENATVGAGVTAYSDTSPSEGNTYYYRVRAYNALNSPYSNEASATTFPAAPSGLAATAASSSQINLSWTDNSGGETGFKIEGKTGAGGTYSQIGTTAAGVTTYGDSGLGASTTYYYRVRAYNAGGNSDYSSEASASTPAAPAGGGGGGGGGGCFIATAAFGSPLERHVQILRDFRDRVLLNSSAGKVFVDFYYRTSPPIAGKIAASEGLRLITRAMLMPVIGMAYLMVHLGMFMTMLLFTAIVLTLIFTIVMWRKRCCLPC